MAKPSPSHANDPSLLIFGRAIREARKNQNMSQEELALASGLDRSYVGGVERGEHNIALINMLKISTALKVELSHLLKNIGNQP